MTRKQEKRLHCSEFGARGAGEDGLARPCRIGKEHGPEARQRYFEDLARKGGQASRAKRGKHRLDIASLPSLDGHGIVKAGVEQVHGRGFHGFRRLWVSKRKHLPRSDVAWAGGWKDPSTLDLYEQPDPDSMQEVVMEGRRFRLEREGGSR